MTEEKRPVQNEQDATEEAQETEVSVVSEATESSDESPGFAFGDDAVQKLLCREAVRIRSSRLRSSSLSPLRSDCYSRSNLHSSVNRCNLLNN